MQLTKISWVFSALGVSFDVAEADAEWQADVVGQSDAADVRCDEQAGIANFRSWAKVAAAQFHVFRLDSGCVQNSLNYFKYLLGACFSGVRASGQRC